MRHQLEQLDGLRSARRGLSRGRWAHDGFGDLAADRQHRVQRRHRILEDHRRSARRGSARSAGGAAREQFGASIANRAA